MWDSEKGYGRLTSQSDLKIDYWDHYEDLSDSPNTELLNKIRHKVCSDYSDGMPRLDFGIGNGEFIKSNPGDLPILGFDVDTQSVTWLLQNDLYHNFYAYGFRGLVTFWDSLEHLPNVDQVLELCRGDVIVSMPVYDDREDVLVSKHFKPNEHVWYFSKDGFVEFMDERGFQLLFMQDLEGLCRREGIFTFAFRRYE